jgi:CelD/BcsL family acetyltransferase involved in cellulose biosynthesis
MSLETKLRRLAAMGELHLRSYQTVGESLPRFVELETGHPTCSKHHTRSPLRATLRFYQEVAVWAEQRGSLRIFSFELNGKPLSMVYGITWAGTFYALRVAHDRHFQMYAPGQLAVMRTLQNLPEHGITRCEFVGPITPWKEVWATTSRKHLCHIIFRPNARGKTPLAPAFLLQKRGEAVWAGTRALFASVIS